MVDSGNAQQIRQWLASERLEIRDKEDPRAEAHLLVRYPPGPLSRSITFSGSGSGSIEPLRAAPVHINIGAFGRCVRCVAFMPI